MKPAPRLIVPDLARGLALLGIATANVSQAWLLDNGTDPGATLGGIHPGSSVDSVVAVLAAMFVHVRGLPMFTTLLGFGFGLIAASLHRKGYPPAAARKVLIRRYGFLALFGFAHMFLLFYGDIMSVYGAIGIVAALMLTAPTKALRITVYCALGLTIVITAVSSVAMYMTDSAYLPELRAPAGDLDTLGAYLASNAQAAVPVAVSLPVAVISIGALVLLGIVWAREGYLTDVDTHRRVLLTWVGIAAAVVVTVGLPLGLAAVGVIDPALELPLSMINSTVGLLTGPGILAGLALAVNPIQKRMHAEFAAHGTTTAPAWMYPFVALGKRSMSGYLAQSFLFVALVMPFGLGLGLDATVTGKTAVGVLVWLITLVLASAMEARGIPGPFEQTHRRLAYGRTKRLEPYSPA
ncbi:DUF418 domain-containing protein [Corynebacterium sp. LK2510]|uniref:DUF418 domain-containing protein n=1 Tax=Corynebacterium sp. LK2510 TaxID=3110472 RepID=UPI0034CFAD47